MAAIATQFSDVPAINEAKLHSCFAHKNIIDAFYSSNRSNKAKVVLCDKAISVPQTSDVMALKFRRQGGELQGQAFPWGNTGSDQIMCKLHTTDTPACHGPFSTLGVDDGRITLHPRTNLFQDISVSWVQTNAQRPKSYTAIGGDKSKDIGFVFGVN